MIDNDKHYAIIKAQLREYEDALAGLIMDPQVAMKLEFVRVATMRAMQSVITQLRNQLDEYHRR